MGLVKSSSSSSSSSAYIKVGGLAARLIRGVYTSRIKSPSPNYPTGINNNICPSPLLISNSTTQPPPPPPPPAAASSWPSFSAVWVKWLMGWVISVAFPFWKQRWDQFLALEVEAEMVIEEAEKVAEVVEKVALSTENMSSQIIAHINEEEDTNSSQLQLKKAALLVQHISHETAKDAQSLSNFIHKVGDLKQDVEDLETIVINNINNTNDTTSISGNQK